MIYINDVFVTESKNPTEREQLLRKHLQEEEVILVDEKNVPLDINKIGDFLLDVTNTHYLKAIKTSFVLQEFKVELQQYIEKVENYIEQLRDNENYTTITEGFTQVVEALIEFDKVAAYLQKETIDQDMLREISVKAITQAEMKNFQYVLDLMEYELLPLIHNLFDEANGEI